METLVTGLVVGGLGVLLSVLVLVRQQQSQKVQDVLEQMDQYIWRVVSGLQKAGELEPALEAGEAKLEKALALTEAMLNKVGFKIDFDEDKLAQEMVRWWIEGVYKAVKEHEDAT